MTWEQLKRYLVWLEGQWDAGYIDDQKFDKLAGEAAIQWAVSARDRLGGGLSKASNPG